MKSLILFCLLLSSVAEAEPFVRCSFKDSRAVPGVIEFTREELTEHGWWLSRTQRLSTGQRLQMGAFLWRDQGSLFIQVFDARQGEQPIISQFNDLNAASPRLAVSIAGLIDINCK